jgi:hypothetical protein
MPNLLEQSFEVFAAAHRRETGQVPDGPSFVGGFATLLGVLSGRVDVGMGDATVAQLFEFAQRSLVDYRDTIIRQAEVERRKGG